MPNKLEKSYHVGKAVRPLQSVKQSIRIAASAVMDILGDFTRGVVFIKLWDGTAVWLKSYGCVN